MSKKVMIFKNQYGNYSKGISTKKQDGTYDNAYFPVKFKKGVELESKSQITVLNSFMSFYRNKDNVPVFYEMITDFTMDDEDEERTSIMNENEYNYDDSSILPF